MKEKRLKCLRGNRLSFSGLYVPIKSSYVTIHTPASTKGMRVARRKGLASWMRDLINEPLKEGEGEEKKVGLKHFMPESIAAIRRDFCKRSWPSGQNVPQIRSPQRCLNSCAPSNDQCFEKRSRSMTYLRRAWILHSRNHPSGRNPRGPVRFLCYS